MTISINVSVDNSQVLSLLNRVENKTDWTEELTDIGILLLRSIDLNFAEQGRPTRWTPSQSALNRSGMTLVDTGRLRRSVTVMADESNVFDIRNKNDLILGTDIEYGQWHQPKRPFLMVQKEDVDNMQNIITRSLERVMGEGNG
jgi:phage gpG-like protein